MKPALRALSLSVNGEAVSVPRAAHLRCPACDEVVLRYPDARELQDRAVEAYRRKHHLLSADEVRALRQRFGLSQVALAELLRLGANTVSRWESGRNTQSASMDLLLRLLRDLPGARRFLGEQSAQG